MSINVSFLARYDALDAALVGAGFPATSPWWRKQLERFLTSGRRTFVLRVGRRGGKSSTLCRFAVAWALWGSFDVPPGDTGVVAFVSVSRDESAQRLRTIEAILRALGVTYRRQGDSIELDDRPVAFRTFAASIAGVSGFTAILFVCDEVAKWRDSDSGSNPATEVLASARPTMATQATARMFLCSSPLSALDAHAVAFDQGDTDTQLVAHAETWLANPSVSEADTHALERDARIWSREFAAVPSAAICAAFEQLAIDRGFAHPREHAASHQRVLIVDPSSGRKDTWSWAVVSWVELFGASGPPPVVRVVTRCVPGSVQVDGVWWARDERVEDYFVQKQNGEWIPYVPAKAPDPYLLVHEIDGVDGAFFDQVPADEIVARLARVCRQNGIDTVHSDQREEFALASLFSKHKLRFIPHAYTSASKADGMALLRRWLAEGRLALPQHDRLRTELLQFEERITPSGAITFGARGSGHDDFVCLLLTAAIADLDRGLPGSPTRAPNVRHEVSGR